jgi:hypothetical protein
VLASGSFSSVPLETVCFRWPHSFCVSEMLPGILCMTSEARQKLLVNRPKATSKDFARQMNRNWHRQHMAEFG